MAIGYFLRVGDKTTCGGQILTGDNAMRWYNVAAACEGDMVSCGKHSGTYRIIDGISNRRINNKKHAGTLESISSCPCNSKFIASISDYYSKNNESSKYNQNELIKRITPVKVVEKWITFKLPVNRDYSGLNYVITLDDGQSIKGIFDENNSAKIQLKTQSSQASLVIEDLEINGTNNSLSEVLLAKIKR